MSAECMSELSRKPNTDYTIAMKDEDKSASNLFVDNSRINRDKSPNNCHNNGDPGNEPTDNSRLNPDKWNDGNHTTQSDSKRTKTVCNDFKKGMCRQRFCQYPHVTNADQVIFCHDFQNNACFRANCRFIHRSIEDEEHYRTYGVFPIPPERPPVAANINQPEHHIAPPPAHLHPPHPHMNFYPNRDNMIVNQQQQQQPPPNQPGCPQNASLPLVSRRRSFGMGDSNIDPTMLLERPHMEEIQSPTVSAPVYNTPNTDSSHQCRYIDQNTGQPVNVSAPAPTSAPNSIAQVQPPTISAPPVTSVVITEDVINIYRLYEEHNLLRRRVEINEERELRATNQYLLQENEQLRRQTQCSCTNTIVGTSQITLATAPSMGITMNTSQTLSMSADATQPIISYPVMTHSILPH